MARNRTDENTDATENTNAEVDPKEAAKALKKEARKEAQTLVRDFIKTVENESIKAALILLVGSGARAARGPVSSINTVLRDAIMASGDDGMSEMDIFKQFKIGRPEMTTKVRIFLKTPNPDDRIWVQFFEEDETYRLVGTGASAPDGWDGFTPADENLL